MGSIKCSLSPFAHADCHVYHPQKQLHEERVAALLTDRQLRAQEEERQRSNLMVQVEALSRQVKQLEEALQATTRDYITGTARQWGFRAVRGVC